MYRGIAAPVTINTAGQTFKVSIVLPDPSQHTSSTDMAPAAARSAGLDQWTDWIVALKEVISPSLSGRSVGTEPAGLQPQLYCQPYVLFSPLHNLLSIFLGSWQSRGQDVCHFLHNGNERASLSAHSAITGCKLLFQCAVAKYLVSIQLLYH